MEAMTVRLIRRIRPGRGSTHGRVSVFPLFMDKARWVEHLVLKEALQDALAEVREVTEEGRVPELVVVNRASLPLLILDGEELEGARQNRVLNSSVLLPEKSATIIPVSCTEQGRWSYRTREFRDSDVMMSTRLRGVKNRSVRSSLEAGGAFSSDQGALWEEIAAQARQSSVKSPTSAMKDVHEARRPELGDYVRRFPCQEGQQGVLVAIGGRVAGMDFVARPASYALLHEKIVRSYVMDALLEEPGDDGVADTSAAQAFIEDAAGSTARGFDSVGLGRDIRFEGKRLFGSVLVHGRSFVHLAAFATDGVARRNGSGGMAGFRSRAAFRRPW